MHKLAEWLRLREMSKSDFADAVGVDKSTVGRWIDGSAKPRWDQFPKIYEVTDGEVTPNCFADLPVAA
jgi:hypothetical protein